MCRHAHVPVTLTAEDKAAAKKLSGILIPVYASIVLAVIAVVAVGGGRPQGEWVAAANAPAAR